MEDNIYPIYTRGCINIRGKEVASLCGWEKDTSVSNKILSKIKLISLIISTQNFKIRHRDCWDNERGTDVTDSVIIQISNWLKNICC
ncbi:MAG: hypothetical protein QOA15_07705 [Nitrososphaeraceae archaeon]|nr:hypothetical protein [Nitrososphaeraceae archaeon]